MNKNQFPGLVPHAPTDEFVVVGEKLPIRLIQKLGVTLAWRAQAERIQARNKLCLFQLPAGRGNQSFYFTADINEVIRISDINPHHPFYHNFRLHHRALDIYGIGTNNLMRFDNALIGLAPSINPDRFAIIFTPNNIYPIGLVQELPEGPGMDQLIIQLYDESFHDPVTEYISEGSTQYPIFYHP